MSRHLPGEAAAGASGAETASLGSSIAHGDSAVLAHVRRGDLVESVHHGHALVTTFPGGADGEDAAEGAVALRAGGEIEFYPRSSAKPFQALAMLRAGVQLTDEQLALACASHAGLEMHQQVALSTLASVDLTDAALQNTPDRPLDPEAARAAGEPTRLAQNCSGKHAAMLATCVAAGWETTGYLDPDHPLQRHIMATLAELAGVAPRVSIDGCGAPTPTSTLAGLGRALRRLLTGDEGGHERRIVDVMRRYPELISGPGRLDTQAMSAVPGLVVKGGAEGVLLAGVGPDAERPGATIVVKIADGSPRALPVLLADALRVVRRAPHAGAPFKGDRVGAAAAGGMPVADVHSGDAYASADRTDVVPADAVPGDAAPAQAPHPAQAPYPTVARWEWARVPVLGHGRPVGEIVSVLATAGGGLTGSARSIGPTGPIGPVSPAGDF